MQEKNSGKLPKFRKVSEKIREYVRDFIFISNFLRKFS